MSENPTDPIFDYRNMSSDPPPEHPMLGCGALVLLGVIAWSLVSMFPTL